jgi:hypothetical protein
MPHDEVIERAWALVCALDRMPLDVEYQMIFLNYELNFGKKYSGPGYHVELESLREALTEESSSRVRT